MSFSMNKIETNYTKTLSDYVENLKYEDIPAEVFERAKMIALQTIGVSIGAKKVPIAENANTLGLQMNGGGASQLFEIPLLRILFSSVSNF